LPVAVSQSRTVASLSAESARRPCDWDGPLSAEERGEAERLAHLYALERGGGQLPPFDPALADQDFRQAAAEVVRQRRGG
jgi:hypothetical protein